MMEDWQLLQSHDPGDVIKINVKTEEEEEIPLQMSPDSRDSNVKIEEEDKGSVKCKEEEIPLQISLDGTYSCNNKKEHAAIAPDCETENYDISTESQGHTSTPSPLPGLQAARLSPSLHTEVEHQTDIPTPNHTAQGPKKPHSCPECGRSFSAKSALVVHERIHTGEKPYLCPECGKCFAQKNNLVTHLQIHTWKKQYPCPDCGKCFSETSYLTAHKQSHTAEKPDSSYCDNPQCDRATAESKAPYHRLEAAPNRSTRAKDSGDTIERNVESEEEEVSVEEIPLQISPDGTYNCNNMKEHAITPDCETKTCDISTKSQGHTTTPNPQPELQAAHLSPSHPSEHQTDPLTPNHIAHKPKKPYSCSECGKSFFAKEVLTIHERVHTGERPYVCPECGKGFAQKNRLVRHIRVHTGEKPYSCSECGRCFAVKYNLTAHERLHTGEKPYSCHYCERAFSVRSELIDHERFHTGQRPYICCECGKCFSQELDLINHERIHKGEKP